jgi:hypothetical protein
MRGIPDTAARFQDLPREQSPSEIPQLDLDLAGAESSIFHPLGPVLRMDLTRACLGIHDPPQATPKAGYSRILASTSTAASPGDRISTQRNGGSLKTSSGGCEVDRAASCCAVFGRAMAVYFRLYHPCPDNAFPFVFNPLKTNSRSPPSKRFPVAAVLGLLQWGRRPRLKVGLDTRALAPKRSSNNVTDVNSG